MPAKAQTVTPRARGFAAFIRSEYPLFIGLGSAAVFLALGSWVVDVEFVRRLSEPITLREIKESHLFDDWALVRQGRLSTMSVPENVVAWLKEKKAL